MKRYLPLLILFAFVLLSLPSLLSCHHRKSAEEGELILQKLMNELPAKGDNYRQLLFEAEYNYDFTPEQRIRLRTEQLSNLSLDDKLYDELITGTEALAEGLSNDSLLQEVRSTAFKVYTRQNDPDNSLRIFRREEPALLARGDSATLNFYYAGLTYLYDRIYQADSAIYWHLKTRNMRLRHLNLWYGQMSDFQLKAGHSDQALLYADSSLNCRPLSIAIRLTYAYPVKGKILAARGQTAEALALYAAAMKELDQSNKQITKAKASPIRYSQSEQALIYQYAELLYQSRHIPEAIFLLEKLLPRSNNFDLLLKGGVELLNIKYKRGNYLFPQFLLAQCYHALGQTEKAIRYTHIGDSLQNDYTAHLLRQQQQANKFRSSNQYLHADLRAQKLEARTARLMQYILGGAVCLLLAVIAGGILWWRSRRRRLRQLFDELVRRHAEWMQIRALLAETSGREAFAGKHSLALPAIPIDDDADDTDDAPAAILSDAAAQTSRRHYLTALRVMEEQRPFTDPAFDLIALARLIGTNRTQLSSAINQQAGTSFSNWLAEYRVNYLISQLNGYPDATIDQLYPTAGFTVRSTFYRQFRQVTGLTPKQYLKEKGE